MERNMKRIKTINAPAGSSKRTSLIKKIEDIPQIRAYSFSFDRLNRTHPLFNLGDDIGQSKVVRMEWFLDWLDAMQEICCTDIPKLLFGKFDLHPVDWKQANPRKPDDADQREYLQLRVNKSKGRIIGFCADDTVFHIVWLDPHHNMTDSDGYGTATYYKAPKSEYESMLESLKEKDEIITQLERDIDDLCKRQIPQRLATMLKPCENNARI